MKRLVWLVFSLSVCGGILFSAGCGGGGGGGGGGAGATVPGILDVGITASGPGGASAFAASVLERNRPGIHSQVTSGNYVLKITPTGQTAVSTSSVTISADGKILAFGRLPITANSTNGQYKVEITTANAAAAAQPIFKFYFVRTVGVGETNSFSRTVTTSDTAAALAYDAWPGAPTNTIDSFVPNAAGLSALTANINQNLNDKGMFRPAQEVNFQWGNTVVSAAQQLGQSTPVSNLTSFTVSGYVTAADGVSGSEGTTVTLTSKTNPSVIFSTTTSAGSYSFIGVPNGTYTMVPSRSGHTFLPTSIDVTVNGANVPSQHFQASTSGAGGSSVTMAGQRFSPSQVTIGRGGTVVWTNNDTVAHTVTSTVGEFDSSVLNPGGTVSYTFSTQGTYNYRCNLHPNMTGTVIVQ